MQERDNIAQVFKGFMGIWIYLGQFVWVPSVGLQYEFRKPCHLDYLEDHNKSC